MFFRRILSLALCLTSFPFAVIPEAFAESAAALPESPQAEEQGVEEIRQLVEISQVTETEGMNLEELTDSFAENAMADYTDRFTGFSMQYPSFFHFEDEGDAREAKTDDGHARLLIESMPNDGSLSEAVLTEAIRLENPDAEIVRNDQNGCLRISRLLEDRTTMQTDLYLIAEKSFHHVTVRYPADEKERYDLYIGYMINTMEIQGQDQG